MCLVGIHNDTNDRRSRVILLLDDYYFGTCKISFPHVHLDNLYSTS